MKKFQIELNPIRVTGSQEWLKSYNMVLKAKTFLNAGNNYRTYWRKQGKYFNPCDIIITEIENY